MSKRILKIENPNNNFYVYWVITDFCNQKCSYCPSYLHSGEFSKNPMFSPENVLAVAHKLVDIANASKKKLSVDISGGEPTLQEQLPKILEILKPHGDITIVTNGTRGISWWEELSTLPSKVIISLHPEYYTGNAGVRINQLTDFLTNNSVPFRFNLMCLPDKWDIVQEIINNINEKYRSLIVPKVIQHTESPDQPNYNYSEEQLNFIKNFKYDVRTFNLNQKPIIAYYSDGSLKNVTPNILTANLENCFEGWKCSAGIDSIAIRANGQVKTGICGVQVLGDITNFSLLENYGQCTKKYCICPADIILTKHCV